MILQTVIASTSGLVSAGLASYLIRAKWICTSGTLTSAFSIFHKKGWEKPSTSTRTYKRKYRKNNKSDCIKEVYSVQTKKTDVFLIVIALTLEEGVSNWSRPEERYRNFGGTFYPLANSRVP